MILGRETAVSDVTGYVKAAGRKLVNGKGREILLRGVGLGGWLLPEGYMWCLPGQGDRPRRMEKMVEALIGEEKAKRFWNIYFERYISEPDIGQIAAEGFNSIRIPINARHLLDDSKSIDLNAIHLQLIDCVIEWCKKYGIYVILDLHGAPGGQTGTNIDDSENDKPELFMNECYRHTTIKIWRMLAERYRNEWIVAGYDLLNEPLPDWFSAYNNQVMPLYRDIAEAIRAVDRKHMIILEGVHWATDWSVFNERIDDNLMLEFHKYWNNPDTESIQAFLDKRDEWNIPIFMGEGGENNKEWLTGAFRLYEDHDISWNFWTWKKMNRSNSPYSIKIPKDWDKIVSYLEGGVKPDNITSEHILGEFLDNIPLGMCQYHPEVANALFRRPPVLIPSVFYGYKGESVSFGVKCREDRQTGFRITDGTDIRFMNEDENYPNFKHTEGEPWKQDEWMYIQLADQDWVSYEISVEAKSKPLLFMVELCVRAADNKGMLMILADNEPIGTIKVDNAEWEAVNLKDEIHLAPGLHKIVIKSIENSIALKWLEITPKGNNGAREQSPCTI